MRVTLLGHHDIASLYSMHRIMLAAPEHQYSVFLSGPVRESREVPEALRQLARTDGELCTEFLHDERTSPTLRATTELSAPNNDSGLATLRAAAPDLIVSIRYRRILKDSAIAIPRRGVINLHSGILPDYRGVMATFWAMLNGESEVGSTLHRITDSGIDTGPIIEITRQAMRPELSYLENVLGLYDAGCAAILRAMDSISRGCEPPTTVQTRNAGAYFSTPTTADLERFHAKGLLFLSGNERNSLNFS